MAVFQIYWDIKIKNIIMCNNIYYFAFKNVCFHKTFYNLSKITYFDFLSTNKFVNLSYQELPHKIINLSLIESYFILDEVLFRIWYDSKSFFYNISIIIFKSNFYEY